MSDNQKQMLEKFWRDADESFLLVRNEPFSNKNNGPGEVPLKGMNLTTALTGQNLLRICTNRTTEPVLNGSVTILSPRCVMSAQTIIRL